MKNLVKLIAVSMAVATLFVAVAVSSAASGASDSDTAATSALVDETISITTAAFPNTTSLTPGGSAATVTQTMDVMSTANDGYAMWASDSNAATYAMQNGNSDNFEYVTTGSFTTPSATPGDGIAFGCTYTQDGTSSLDCGDTGMTDWDVSTAQGYAALTAAYQIIGASGNQAPPSSEESTELIIRAEAPDNQESGQYYGSINLMVTANVS